MACQQITSIEAARTDLERYLAPQPAAAPSTDPYVGEFGLRGAEEIAAGIGREEAFVRFQSRVKVHNRLRVAVGRPAVHVPTMSEFSYIVDRFLQLPSVSGTAPRVAAST